MKKKARRRVIIMGAGGRDFHDFNVVFRDDPSFEVAAFTAAQIPFIEKRTYPASLAGGLYPDGIPIHPEEELPGLIERVGADAVVFAYSDVTHEEVMHKASSVMAAGADFFLLGPSSTQLVSKLPVISVCAVRTGCGKSPVTRKVMEALGGLGRRPAAIRHPMAYCDLERQRAQKFASIEDVDRMGCTVEEREEYEPLLEAGFPVYAGVDYADVLALAERDADIIVWDGGNNDFPFIRPDLEIVVADALRPGHGMMYHPGETNLRRADVIIVNKVSEGSAGGLRKIKLAASAVNPSARIIVSESPVEVRPVGGAAPGPLKGKKVLVVEDGPTLTHGGMSFGAGTVAARELGAKPVSPRAFAKGSFRDVMARYPHIDYALPAMGYSPGQIKDLEDTIAAAPCDAVLFATPVDLVRLVNIDVPAYRVTYSIREKGRLTIAAVVKVFLEKIH